MSIQYNSILILSYFFICFSALILNLITKGKTNNLLFSSYRNTLLSPLTYVRLVTHSIGHSNWSHFMNNFIYILLVGPMIEEKYGSVTLLKMMLITSLVIGLFNFIFSKRGIIGASGIVFMLITLSSAVNLENGKIPLTLILVCLFFVISEIVDIVIKRDNVSHISHFIGAVCGIIFVFYPI